MACGPQQSGPVGLALLRISELSGRCVVEKDANGLQRVATNLPFRSARATASFQASERWPGGHLLALGWKDDDGRLGLLQVEVPPERGYGIAEFPNQTFTQSLAFAEWRSGQVLFAATKVGGYFNYFESQVAEKDFLGKDLPATPDRKPGKGFVLVALDGRDPSGAEVCRVVAAHASAERPRELPWDPSWLLKRASLHITAETNTLTVPALTELEPPGEALVTPADAPADPGQPAPRMLRHAPAEFATGWGSSNPCD